MPANEILISPRVELEYAKVLGQPHGFEGSTEDRNWSVNGLLDDQDPLCEQLIEKIKEKYLEVHGKKKPHQHGLPFKPHTDKDGNATGKMRFTFKRKEFAYNGEPNTPPIVVDSTGVNKWPKEMLIGNGSKGLVKFHIYGWGVGKASPGVGLELRSIQVQEHVPYEVDDGTFKPAEGGFVLPADQVAEEPAAGACGLTPPPSAGACDFQSQVSAAVAELGNDDDMPF